MAPSSGDPEDVQNVDLLSIRRQGHHPQFTGVLFGGVIGFSIGGSHELERLGDHEGLDVTPVICRNGAGHVLAVYHYSVVSHRRGGKPAVFRAV